MTTTSNDQTDRRWVVCCHEAGHALAARHLLNARVLAVAIGSGDGATGCVDYGARDNVRRTFAEAVIVAAGVAGERLAWSRNPPTAEAVEKAEPIEKRYPTTAAGVASDIGALPSDEESLVAWAVAGASRRGPALDWRRWRQRAITVRWAARQFVNSNREEIEAVARRLYLCGLVVIEKDSEE